VLVTAGLLSGWWLAHRSGSLEGSDTTKARAALGRIRELASSVAQDVGEHTSRVKEISDELHDVTSDGSVKIDQVVLDTVTKMVAANESLQSKLADAEQRLQQQAAEIETHAADARTDQLTRIHNRRAFDDEMQRRFVEWKRIRSPYCLFMVDVDHFKRFNDIHGHQAGDQVLRGVARVLKETMREMDVVCRYGGEEFAVIMPATEGEVAKQGAERARTAIDAATFEFEGTPFHVTASVGLAQITIDEDTQQLIRRADEALYASKEAGRNCTHYHDGQRCQLISPPRDVHQQTAGDATLEEEDEEGLLPTLCRLANQDIFQQELRRRVSEGLRFDVPLSVLLLSIESYDEVARTYGQQVAQVMLDGVAQYVESLLREMDLLAIGQAGRFSIMLPGSDLKDSSQVADRIAKHLASCDIPLGGGNISLSATIGVASVLSGDSAGQLLDRAEAALAFAGSGQVPIGLHDGQECRAVSQQEVQA